MTVARFPWERKSNSQRVNNNKKYKQKKNKKKKPSKYIAEKTQVNTRILIYSFLW